MGVIMINLSEILIKGKALVRVRGEFELSDNVLELVPVFYRVVVGNVSNQLGEN